MLRSATPLFAAVLLLSTSACAHTPWSAARIRKAKVQVLADPDNAATWMALGDAYSRAHAKRKARTTYFKVLSIEPDHGAARDALANLQPRRKVNRMERKALRHPTNDEIWGDAADEVALSGDMDKALKYYMHALRLDPTDEEWINKVMELGGEEAMLELYREQMQTNPDNDELMGDYGDLLSFLDRRDEACMAYQRAHQLDPEDSEWNDRVSECLSAGVSSSDPGDLVETLEARLEDDPENDELMGTIGDTLLDAGDHERALEYYREALEADPGDSEWLDKVVALSGEPKVEVLRTLCEDNPTNDELWGNLGDHELELGHRSEALECFRKAQALDPGDEEWGRKLKMFSEKNDGKIPSSPEEPSPEEGG